MSRALRLRFDAQPEMEMSISIVGSRFQHWQRGLSWGDGLMICCQALSPVWLMLVAPADMNTVWLHVEFQAGTVSGGCCGSHSPFWGQLQAQLHPGPGGQGRCQQSVSISSCFISSTMTALLPPPCAQKHLQIFVPILFYEILSFLLRPSSKSLEELYLCKVPLNRIE